MQKRKLGKTDLELPILSFGASSLGAEFRGIDINEAMKAVRVALDCGMTFIDTSPFYGRGMSEVLLGVALEGVPRDSYILGSKLGRYDVGHFDFSAKRVVESVDVSLKRMRVDHLDLCLCHDLEFVEMSQIVNETLPALRKIQQQGKVRYIGVSGYPMKMFKYILANAPIDVLLSYNHYTLQNTMLEGLLPLATSKGCGVMNAAPFSARLLSNAAQVAQGDAPRPRDGDEGGRALHEARQRHRQAGRPVLRAPPRDRDVHRGLGQPGARRPMGDLGRGADRREAPAGSAGNPGAHPRLVLYRRAAGEQR